MKMYDFTVKAKLDTNEFCRGIRDVNKSIKKAVKAMKQFIRIYEKRHQRGK